MDNSGVDNLKEDSSKVDNLKVVITGGAGFIGSHIAEFWTSRGAEVHVIDNLRSGHLKNVTLFPKINFHRGSITDRDLVFSVLEGADYVHHLAAMVSVPESVMKPQECVEINVLGLLNVLDAARQHKVKKVVHSSSAAVYGDNPESPKFTSMRPMPKSPYGITKLDGEYYLEMYRESFKTGTVSLRYFNVFGPRQDPQSQYAAAIPIFVSRALKNEPITIYGDGSQTRDFVFVKDVVAANVIAAENKEAHGVFNVANGSSITIKELAELITKETGSKSRIIFEEERPGDIKHSLASIKDTVEGLGFSPKFNLIDGLKETIAYFVKEFSSGKA
ncbi:MAG TPA: NAD-dependent epimerase/dehydratase family protein [Ignavibacteriales bacterium]|nr:NAD-dependent epimerase/dehydratase family protein [Ignavibacteriales bacterium]